jgi:medium-chain acyl-[acyl-carrier-protein] hydrolase
MKTMTVGAGNMTTPRAISIKPDPAAKLRLFCLPYAGAGASVFRRWPLLFPREIQVVPVQLPGRESRIREGLLTSIEELVEVLIGEFLDETKPYAFFGHSMGALIGYELARKLRDKGKCGPVHLFVSARRAPSLTDDRTPLHQMDDAALIEKMREFKGTPEEVFQHPELIDFWLRIFRADLAACENYKHTQERPLDCPITAFSGLEDKHVPQDEMLAWQNETRAGFKLRALAGDHFFLHRYESVLVQSILEDLRLVVTSA